MNPSAVSARWDVAHPEALAIYCSDGRFTEAVEELLRSLGHARLDTMTLPGGPALFEATTADFAGLETVRSASTFLVQGHALKHVLLLAHEGCGYYRARAPREEPGRIVDRQVADLRSAARWFRSNLAAVSVALFYARVAEQKIEFQRVQER